jgi:hypothetical protein
MKQCTLKGPLAIASQNYFFFAKTLKIRQCPIVLFIEELSMGMKSKRLSSLVSICPRVFFT